MSETARRIIVIRRPVKAAAHHGGAWKIAFADFMTAMFAFFLVLWILSISSPKQLEGIADQFKMPLKVAINGGKKSSTSTNVIPGGGADMTHADGEVRQASGESSKDPDDGQRLEALKERLDDMIESSPVLRQFRPQLLIDITPEGLRIQIVDSNNRPMFDRSSAVVVAYMRSILREIGPVLQQLGAVGRSRQRLAPRTGGRRHAGRENPARHGRLVQREPEHRRPLCGRQPAHQHPGAEQARPGRHRKRQCRDRQRALRQALPGRQDSQQREQRRPRHQAGQHRARRRRAAAEPRLRQTRKPDMTNKKTILVVDDSAVMRHLNSAVLEEGGYQVLLAGDGKAALEQLVKKPVDLVLTDWTMIPMDGCELTRQLRARPDSADLPILVLSTLSNDASKADARKAGATGWLCKPIEPETLLAVVGSLMNPARA
jgi:CheY-like chemotaxis protein